MTAAFFDEARGREVKTTKKKTNDEQIREQAERAALLGLERLQEILSSPDTAPADVFKGLTLLFDRIYQPQGEAAGGDYEIRLTP